MGYRYITSSNGDLRLTTERIKALKVIGESIAQVVAEGSITMNAIKIEAVHGELIHLTHHVFQDKVVLQGKIHKQILYVDPTGTVRHTTEDIPFMAAVDIPGVDPNNSFLEVQTHPLSIEIDHSLISGVHEQPATLMQKVVARILVKVSEWAQMDVVTEVNIYPKITNTGMYCCKNHPKPFSFHGNGNNMIPINLSTYLPLNGNVIVGVNTNVNTTNTTVSTNVNTNITNSGEMNFSSPAVGV